MHHLVLGLANYHISSLVIHLGLVPLVHANTQSSIGNLLMEVSGTYADTDTRCCVAIAQGCILLLEKLVLRLYGSYLIGGATVIILSVVAQVVEQVRPFGVSSALHVIQHVIIHVHLLLLLLNQS